MTKKQKVVSRQRCEVYSRVVGYIRPVTQWNPGKQSEYCDRVTFNS
jgi:ribonucleoside-triphosphate reductase